MTVTTPASCEPDPDDLDAFRAALEIANRLRDLDGWDQARIARMVGIAGSSLSRLRSGELSPTGNTAKIFTDRMLRLGQPFDQREDDAIWEKRMDYSQLNGLSAREAGIRLELHAALEATRAIRKTATGLIALNRLEVWASRADGFTTEEKSCHRAVYEANLLLAYGAILDKGKLTLANGFKPTIARALDYILWVADDVESALQALDLESKWAKAHNRKTVPAKLKNYTGYALVWFGLILNTNDLIERGIEFLTESLFEVNDHVSACWKNAFIAADWAGSRRDHYGPMSEDETEVALDQAKRLLSKMATIAKQDEAEAALAKLALRALANELSPGVHETWNRLMEGGAA